MASNWAVVVEGEDGMVVVVVDDDRLLLILVPFRLPPPGNR